MSNITVDIVQKLWNLCNVLKDDGVTYHQYVTELTYLLFLKMAKETGTEDQLPKKHRWDDLEGKAAPERLEHYKLTLIHLGGHGSRLVQEIFANASSFIKKPATLSTLVSEIDKLDWYSARQEGLGDLYEGLLEKNANEKKSGAGQYFTPRRLIDAMVAVVKPTIDDVIQDPAAGTGGFLIAANHYIREQGNPDSWTEAQQRRYRRATFYGMEHVQDTHRLALMNLMLHGLESDPEGAGVRYGDTLSPDGEALPKATLILTNPPFGTKKGGGLPSRTDFTFPTSNKQFCFLQHVYRGLKPGGRAAVVLPDNVLFEGNVGKEIRADLMDKCNLHTILRLPTGIFYAQGVKTNVLFFTRGESDKGNTKEVWVYDLRVNMPQFGKRTVLAREHFAEFEAAFGKDPLGAHRSLARRKDTGEEGRFRKFAREWIAARDENLDIGWLRDESAGSSEELPEPAVLARETMDHLEEALGDLRGIVAELGEAADAGRSKRERAAARLTSQWREERLGSDGTTSWSEFALADLCTEGRVITYGVIKLGDEVPDGVPCLRTSNVRWLRFDLDGLKRIAPQLSDEYGRTVLQGGEVLVNVRGTLGGVAVADESMRGWNVSREVAVVPVDLRRVMPKYLSFWIGADRSQRWLAGVEKGVAYTGINIEDLRTLPVSLPPLEEQREIVRRVEELLQLTDRVEARHRAAVHRVSSLPAAVLAKAFRGELVPQDPNHEPASVMLERLGAQRSATTGGRGRTVDGRTGPTASVRSSRRVRTVKHGKAR